MSPYAEYPQSLAAIVPVFLPHFSKYHIDLHKKIDVFFTPSMADWSKNKRFSAETYFYLEYHKLHGKSISFSGFSFLYSEGESATKAAFQTGY